MWKAPQSFRNAALAAALLVGCAGEPHTTGGEDVSPPPAAPSPAAAPSAVESPPPLEPTVEPPAAPPADDPPAPGQPAGPEAAAPQPVANAEAGARDEGSAGPAGKPAPKPRKPEVAPKVAQPSPEPAPQPKPADPPPQPKAAAPTGPCGDDGQPMCPLQAWMDRHMQGPFDREDMPALASALRKAAKMAPDPAWNAGDKGWAPIANAAATAADAGDFATARKSCKGCHRAWRKKYKGAYRKRPVP